jgi:hypothetical protein
MSLCEHAFYRRPSPLHQVPCHEADHGLVFINRALGKRQSWCRPCDAVYKREWYAKNRELHGAKVRASNRRTLRENQARAWMYLSGHPCVDCGESDPLVLEFDHLRDKRQTICFMVQRKWCCPRSRRKLRSAQFAARTATDAGRPANAGTTDEVPSLAYKIRFPSTFTARNNLRRAVSSVDRAFAF